MTPQGRFKRCPKCQTAAAIDAPNCLACGHRFSTQFAPPQPSVNQTQSFLPITNKAPPNIAPPLIAPGFLSPAQQAKARQPAQVTQDPKYLVNTGICEGCPACGSTNVVAVGKPGTGLSAFGSIGWVLGASLVEAAVQSGQAMVLQCGFCGSSFT